jgi:hypothetical protein
VSNRKSSGVKNQILKEDTVGLLYPRDNVLLQNKPKTFQNLLFPDNLPLLHLKDLFTLNQNHYHQVYDLIQNPPTYILLLLTAKKESSGGIQAFPPHDNVLGGISLTNPHQHSLPHQKSNNSQNIQYLTPYLLVFDLIQEATIL